MMRNLNAFCRLLVLSGSLLLIGVPAKTVLAKDELIIGITQYPSTLHPNIDSMLAKSYVLGMTQRPFTLYDHDWVLTCQLCVELPTLDNGGAVLLDEGDAAIAVSYRIRPDARWGDGTPLTTADVLFAREAGSHPESRILPQELYRRILDIEVHDEHRFTLYLDRVTFDYSAINDFRPLPAHIERPIFESDPGGYHNRTAYVTDPTQAGLYFGPYRITRVERGDLIVLEPNQHWWGEPPHFRRIVVRAIPSSAALEANLLAGEIDMIAGELGLAVDQALAFEQQHGDRFRILYQPGLIYEHLDVNLDNPLLADRRVRQALLYAADREAIDQQLFQGRQPVAHSSVNPLDWVYDDSVPQYRHDPERAAALLDDAGWDRLRNGIRHNADGQPLRLTLMTTAGDRTRELVQQVLQSQWRRLGIDVRIDNQPARVFFGETLSRREFTGLALFAWISAPESVPRTTLHSEEIPSAANNFRGQNYPGYRNPAVDELLDALEVELDRERRRTMWAELQRHYATDLPALPLYFRANAFILPDWLDGVRPTGHLHPSTLWVEQWHPRRP